MRAKSSCLHFVMEIQNAIHHAMKNTISNVSSFHALTYIEARSLHSVYGCPRSFLGLFASTQR